jgi:hypothetical protein
MTAPDQTMERMRSILAGLIAELDQREQSGRRFGKFWLAETLRNKLPEEFMSAAVFETVFGAGLTAELRDEITNDKGLGTEILKQAHRHRAGEIMAELRDAQTDTVWNDGLLSTMSDAEVEWRCDGLLAQGGRLLVQAQYKAGKTTMLLNLARCLATGGHFLGRFDTTPVEGNVGYLNYEVSEALFLRWARQVGVPLDRLYVNNLRGMANPFRNERDLERLADRLLEHEVYSLIVDPYARAFNGDDLDRTGPAVAFTNALDRLAELADLSEISIANHAGHDAERGRNSTVLLDWADTILTLTKDKDTDLRYVKAIGRDVELAEDRLDFDPETHLLTLSGTGGRRANTRQDKIASLVAYAAQAVAQSPDGAPVSGSQIEEHFRYLKLPFTKGDGNKAAEKADDLGVRLALDEGPRRPKWWRIDPDAVADDASDWLKRAERDA